MTANNWSWKISIYIILTERNEDASLNMQQLTVYLTSLLMLSWNYCWNQTLLLARLTISLQLLIWSLTARKYSSWHVSARYTLIYIKSWIIFWLSQNFVYKQLQYSLQLDDYERKWTQKHWARICICIFCWIVLWTARWWWTKECAKLSRCYKKSLRNLFFWQSHQVEQRTSEIWTAQK